MSPGHESSLPSGQAWVQVLFATAKDSPQKNESLHFGVA
jgi:hypothetical protein